VAGGYLVLEHPNLGISVATSSRFYTTVQLKPLRTDVPSSKSNLTLVVESPQFYTTYTYIYNPATNKVTGVGKNGNPFVEKCIDLTMAFIKEFKTKDGSDLQTLLKTFSHSHYLSIVLQANNDFYSQIKELKRRKLPLLSSSLLTLPKFIPCPKDASGDVEIAKTGLGSSAALTTSLVSSLLQWFEVTRVGLRPDLEDRRVVHNLAQLVHANAQGKIGSGFDVAAAVYGTQMYRRFSSYAFEACLDENVPPEVIYSAVMSEGVGAAIPTTASVNALLDLSMMAEKKKSPEQAMRMMKTGWSQTIRPFSLPYGMDVVLGDVCGGSSSTSMARQVLKWRREKPNQAEKIWDALSATNTDIFDTLEALNAQYRRDPLVFNADVKWASQHIATAWADRTDSVTVSMLWKLRGYFETSRRLLKKMGDSAGVGIEPAEQTRLCDATALLPGVVAAGVPGAGGVDAIFAITLSDEVRNGVEQMWSKWDTLQISSSGNNNEVVPSVCPLTLSAGKGLRAGIVAHFNGSENYA